MDRKHTQMMNYEFVNQHTCINKKKNKQHILETLHASFQLLSPQKITTYAVYFYISKKYLKYNQSKNTLEMENF